MTDSLDSFQKFEEKIAHAIEVVKRLQSEKKALQLELERVKSAAKERAQVSESHERELVALRREREEVRTRVEKLLDQIDSLTTESEG
jgi:FtsZ-binding cell division protein ZapB